MNQEDIDKIAKTILDKLTNYDQGELFNFIWNYRDASEERKHDIRKRISSSF